MRKVQKHGCRTLLLTLCAVLLVGCGNSYVEVSEGKGWDTLGYQTGTLAELSDQTDPSGSSAVIMPDRVTDPATPESSDVTLTPIVTYNPLLTTVSQTADSPETAPAENPDVGLTLLVFTQTVAKGSKATVSIRGLPNTEYTIKVKYSSGYSSASGLEPQISDADGICSWTWRVGGSTKPGSYPITISDGINSYTLTFTVE